MKTRMTRLVPRFRCRDFSAKSLIFAWLISCAFFAYGCGSPRAPEIYVHFPQSPEDLEVPAVRATVVLGNVQPAGSTLTINGRPARVRGNGTFLEYIALKPGDFVVRFQASNRAGSSTLDLPLRVVDPVTHERNNLLDLASLEPAEDLGLTAGDRLLVRARGASLLTGSFDIDGLRHGIPLMETTPGHYEGEYRIGPHDRAHNRSVRVTLGDPLHFVQAMTRGRMTIIGPEQAQIAILEREREGLNRILRSPEGSPLSVLPNGVRVVVNGRNGNAARVRLSGGLDGWLPRQDLRMLPPGTPEPQVVLQSARVSSETRSSRLILPLGQRVPYRIEHVGNRFTVVLSYATLESEHVNCHSADGRVVGVRCGGSENTVRVDLTLGGRQPLWGYHADYTPKGLELELRWPPAGDSESPLSGVVILLDPGHSPSDSGRLGPLGIPERTHNLRLARRLAPLLQAEGAEVVMTRTRDDQEISLQRRLDIAWAAKGDLFISLHCNSVGHGVDPSAAPRGFSMYYGQPYSIGLADAIHAAYLQFLPLADEGVHCSDLFVTTAPEMPSVLVESAYFIVPEQEQLLLEEAFQKQIARALLAGIKNLLQARFHSAAESALHQPKRMERGL